MPTVRTGPAIGLTGQIALFAALAATVGMGIAGWLVGVTYGVVTCLVLSRGLQTSGTARLGPADRVTLFRATLVGGVAALTVDAFFRPTPVAVFVALAAVALSLDAVDGKVARRTGTVSALGARFDMEIDAFLILVLSVYVLDPAGPWVLAIGAMRYAFVAASWVLPWMTAQLPPRLWRKAVAAIQGVILAIAAADVLPGFWRTVILVAALAVLIESFGHDVAWLFRHRPVDVRVPAELRVLVGARVPVETPPVAAEARVPVGAGARSRFPSGSPRAVASR